MDTLLEVRQKSRASHENNTISCTCGRTLHCLDRHFESSSRSRPYDTKGHRIGDLYSFWRHSAHCYYAFCVGSSEQIQDELVWILEPLAEQDR